MFSEMVHDLEHGIFPDLGLLRGRCHAAVTKKLALVRLPPAYWESDPKRNPDTRHLLWAILLLHDLDLFEVIKGIILMEEAEGKGLSAEDFWTNSVEEFLALAPDLHFKALLQEQVAWVEKGPEGSHK
ncbi:MAG: hypothetical protein KJ804_09755 [Proteobacteria bacterium]|nr:hypothetical protein [Pseudomonadota bacterium]MBU1058586.1 hypothetical protein [Pseudomonadota bacterium]